MTRTDNTNADGGAGAEPNTPAPTCRGCCLHDAKVVEHPDFVMPEYFAPLPPVTTDKFVPWSASGSTLSTADTNATAVGPHVRQIRTGFADELTRLGP